MLTASALLVLALLLLGGAAVPLARLPAGPAVVHGGALGVSVALALLAAGGLLFGLPTGDFALPFGPPWGPMRLALDGLSAWFLLLLGLTGACSALFALGLHGTPARVLAPFPLFLAGMALTLLAADGFTLLLGFELMSLASWALVAAEDRDPANARAARLYLVFAAIAGACLIPALGLLAGPAGDLSFAALRERPPEGWRATLVLLLVLAGAGSKAGLAPLHVWLPLAHPAAPSHVSALMSGAMTKVALYVMARLLLDLCGPAQPVWWGAPLVLLGAASAILGALRANLETDTKTLLACSTIENVGLVAMGLGLALAFRGADLGALAALAAGAALLHALAHGLFKTLLFLVAGEVLHGALSRHLDRLGGLVHPMPWTAGAALVGALAAAALPPLSGFAGEWLLLQALLAAWRIGDIALQIGAAAAVAVTAMATALAAAAMLRFYGLVFLGRPRTPRAAGAVEQAGAPRLALLLPAALTVLIGLLPGPLLAMAEPALRVLVRSGALPAAGLFGLGAGEAAASYLPLAVLLLLGAATGALLWLARRHAPAGVARSPAWDCGFIAPPAHLPFGDPATQPSGAGIGQPLRRMLGEPLLGAHERIDMPEPGETRAARLEAGFRDPSEAWILAPLDRGREALVAWSERLRDLSIRQCLMLSFGTLVLLMALVGWLEAG